MTTHNMFCPKCGSKTTGTGNFCNNCGAELKAPLAQPMPHERVTGTSQAMPIHNAVAQLPAPKRKKRHPVLILGMIVGAALLAFIAVSLIGYNTPALNLEGRYDVYIGERTVASSGETSYDSGNADNELSYVIELRSEGHCQLDLWEAGDTLEGEYTMMGNSIDMIFPGRTISGFISPDGFLFFGRGLHIQEDTYIDGLNDAVSSSRGPHTYYSLPYGALHGR